MTDERDPVRLLDPASGSSARLQELLVRAREDLPSKEQLGALESRLAPLIWSPGAGGAPEGGQPAAPSPGGASSAASSGGFAKLAGGALLLALAGGGAILVLHRGGEEPGTPERPTIAATPPRIADPRTAKPAEAARPTAKPAPEASTAPKAAAKAAPPSAGQNPAPRLSEAELLYAARKALKDDPRRAMKLVEEHRRRFPSGMLTQEREVIAIEALASLGKEESAVERAERFKRRYPGSAHAGKVDGVVRER